MIQLPGQIEYPTSAILWVAEWLNLFFTYMNYISKHIYGLILSHKAYSRLTLEAEWPNRKCMQSARIHGNAGPTWACHHLYIPPPTLIPLPLNSKQIPTTQGGAPITSYKRQQTHPCTPDSGWGGESHAALKYNSIYVCKRISTEPESSIWFQSFTLKQAYGWPAAKKVHIF